MRTLATTLLAAVTFAAYAQVPEAITDRTEDPPDIFIEVQVVALPSRVAVPIIRQLSDPKVRSSGLEAIDAKLTTGECQVLGWPMVTTKSGQRAYFQDVRELRFVTQYAPAVVNVTSEDDVSGVHKNTAIPETVFSPVPDGFETQTLGFTFEPEATLKADGRTIDLNVTMGHDRLNAMRPMTISKNGGKEKVVTEQPEIDKFRVSANLTVESGSRVLLGVFPTSEPKDHMELLILRAEVRPKSP